VCCHMCCGVLQFYAYRAAMRRASFLAASSAFDAACHVPSSSGKVSYKISAPFCSVLQCIVAVCYCSVVQGIVWCHVSAPLCKWHLIAFISSHLHLSSHRIYISLPPSLSHVGSCMSIYMSASFCKLRAR